MSEVLSRPPAGRAQWSRCPGCRLFLYERKLARNLGVCPECGWHGRLTAPGRLDQLLDAGSRRALDIPVATGDPLGFTDSRPYPERLREARASTGLEEAVVCARGAIEGNAVIVAAMDFRFLGGSLGAAAGELIAGAAGVALSERTPLLIVTASGGARMQEGAIALMQMAKTSQALGELDEAGVLTVSLITDPTFGGVAASFATLCDVIIAEPGARLGFAGRRVIEQTIRQTLPDDFQTAEFLLEHGVIDLVRPRSVLRGTLGRLLATAARRPPAGLPPEPGPDAAHLVTDPAALPDRDAWETVRSARDIGRPTTLDYAGQVFEEFLELHGDRLAADCPAIVGGLARLGGLGVVAIGHQKGHDVAELTRRDFGMPMPAGYRKAARLMRLAAKLGLPVVTFVDTPGAHPGAVAEEQGQSVAIAENLRLMAALPVPVVAVVTGEGGSGGALALAVADRVLALSGAVYSVISPEGCASILWRDAAAAPRAAAALRLDARRLLGCGVLDAVVEEPDGGARGAPAQTAARLRAALAATLRELLPLDAAAIVAARRARFRRFRGEGPSGIADPH
ncbi:acetyl-CoA carboxylase, carboxyltransferase subunit beta [Actinomadura formosensis]|uniref:acetyl-CoA carboxylase, carboxyltransferase subunit beta n=1 Tax=Actinomadura formosensis TaxID=60706 RepID=UPI003D8C1F52